MCVTGKYSIFLSKGLTFCLSSALGGNYGVEEHREVTMWKDELSRPSLVMQ